MSLVNWRAVSNTLNVLMQNWMQNSHAAITGHKSGRGVTWDAFWTMCPIHKGWVQRGKALLGVHKKCLAFHTQIRATPPQALMGVCYSGQADREWNPTGVATSYSWREGTLLRRGEQHNSAGQQQCPCLQGFPLCCWTRQRCCLAGLCLLHQRAGAAPAPHPDWSRVSGRPWHCHPEPL